MKKAFLFIILSLIVISCNPSPPVCGRFCSEDECDACCRKLSGSQVGACNAGETWNCYLARQDVGHGCGGGKVLGVVGVCKTTIENRRLAADGVCPTVSETQKWELFYEGETPNGSPEHPGNCTVHILPKKYVHEDYGSFIDDVYMGIGEDQNSCFNGSVYGGYFSLWNNGTTGEFKSSYRWLSPDSDDMCFTTPAVNSSSSYFAACEKIRNQTACRD